MKKLNFGSKQKFKSLDHRRSVLSPGAFLFYLWVMMKSFATTE
ncbi:hypothetical protein LEP1GSC041_2882 [Leptospira noguchii str. 2006001870]|nr:hypothetical protein LEP1GSC041_2882 [Leptospira noguchii str. 2006001870]